MAGRMDITYIILFINHAQNKAPYHCMVIYRMELSNPIPAKVIRPYFLLFSRQYLSSLHGGSMSASKIPVCWEMSTMVSPSECPMNLPSLGRRTHLSNHGISLSAPGLFLQSLIKSQTTANEEYIWTPALRIRSFASSATLFEVVPDASALAKTV